MNKYFVNLANSYKHGNRCLAGIELVNSEDGKWKVLEENGSPKGFRPISKATKDGAIPLEEALNFKILDIVCVENIEPCPEGAQKENNFYSKMEVVGHLALNERNLNMMIDKKHEFLFSNRGKAVHPESVCSLDYSFLFIKGENVSFYLKDREEYKKVPQPRAVFSFQGYEYDFPVTDPLWRPIIKNDIEKSNQFTHYYLSISLGLENDGWHSKLVANVIPL